MLRKLGFLSKKKSVARKVFMFLRLIFQHCWERVLNQKAGLVSNEQRDEIDKLFAFLTCS